MRDLLWTTFLPWVRVPGAPTYRPVDTPADLPGYRPYAAGHELPGATIDDTRARRVCAWIVEAEPGRVAEIAPLLDRLGLDHRTPEGWSAIADWLRDRPRDAATPSLELDLGLLLGRRVIDGRDGARWESDSDSVLAHPQVVLGTTVIALPLQAVEQGTDLGTVLTTGLEAEEFDPAAEFVAHLGQVLDESDEPPTDDEIGWMLSEFGLSELPELPEALAERLGRSS